MYKKKVLIASPFFPYPPNFGGVYDVFARIKDLKSIGCTIDLVYTEKQKPQAEDIAFLSQYINKAFFVKRKNKIHNLLSLKPLQVNSRSGLRNIFLEENYDLLIIEGDSAAEVLKNNSLKAKKRVLRVHNNESYYFKNLAKSATNPLEKLYYYSESIKFKKYSKMLYKSIDRLWFISKDEYSNYKKTKNHTKGIHLPSPVKMNETNSINDLNTMKVLFVGALFMPNNLEAIDWYLKNIHEHILQDFPEYTFLIAGSTGRFTKDYYNEKFSGYQAIELFFNLESLDEVYKKASIFVNPMQHGAGVKIKSIHSMINGLPLVSTKIGSEGIGLTDGENYIKGDTPKKFKEGVKMLLQNKNLRKQIAQKGQLFLKENNSEKILKNELSTNLA